MSDPILSKCALGKSPDLNGSCLPDKIKNKMPECKGSDECIINNHPEGKKIKTQYYKTEAESLDGNYWIDNTEIDTCMAQLRLQYPGFAHTFIHMSDIVGFPPKNLEFFDYIVKPLRDLDLGKCLKTAINKQPPCLELSTENNVPIKSIGTIFNTDTSRGSGQHWFAVYISTDHKDTQGKPLILIEVFNSSGLDINIKSFQQYWTEQILKIKEATRCNCEYKLVSTIAHQKDDTGNCGSYSLFYIYSRLNGVRPEDFNNPNRKISDLTAEKFRQLLFTKKK